MKYFIYLFTLTVFFSACSSNRDAVKKENSVQSGSETVSKSADEERREAIAEQMRKEEMRSESEKMLNQLKTEFPETAVARIERTACFGRCPIYTMTIYSNNTAEYIGKKWVEKLGPYKASVPQDKIDQLLARAEEIEFYEMKDIYDNKNITDLPSTIVSLKPANRVKTVIDRFEAPEKLGEFELYIDELFKDLDWKKMDER